MEKITREKRGRERGVSLVVELRLINDLSQCSYLLPAPVASTCLVVEQVRPSRRQLTGQRARLAAESRVVLVGTETRLDNQLAVGKERIVRAVRMQVDTINGQIDLTV